MKLTSLTKIIVLAILLFCFIGCWTKMFSENHTNLTSIDISLITIEFKDKTKQKIIFSDKKNIDAFINSINHSIAAGPWKGAGWDKIKFTNADTTIILNTNGKVFSIVGSGLFYNLDKEYQKYW